jgi:hypothetical protein
VRELDVHRNYPEVGSVIIKRIHGISAPRLIRLLRKTVDAHNARYPDKTYILRKPVAYALNNEYAAMRKIAYPSLDEITGGGYIAHAGGMRRAWDSINVTARGSNFFEEVARGHPNCTMDALKEATLNVEYYTHAVYHCIHHTNIVLAGFEEGRFVFVPLLDLE